MNHPRAIATLVAGSLVMGCSSEDVQTSDVVELTVCPNSECSQVADGLSRIVVRACVPSAVEHRRADLTVRFTTNRGTWVDTKSDPPTSCDASLAAERCTVRELTPPLEAGSIRIGAELGGYRQESVLDLMPVDLDSLSVTSQPSFLPATETVPVSITATVHATSGSPSAGTMMHFAIASSSPEGSVAVLLPSTVPLDKDNKGSATLYAAPDTKLVSIQISATPPGDAKSVTETIVLAAPGS